MPIPAVVPQVDFSILGNLPDTWREAQSGAMRRRALEQLGTNPSAEQLGSTASLLMQAGDDKSIALGLNMMKRAEEMRKTQQEDQALRNLSGGGGAPGPVSMVNPSLVPPEIASAIAEHAPRTGMDPELLTRQTYVESAFRPGAVSPKGARGVSQFMPATAAQYGVNVGSIKDSIRGQADMMKEMTDKYGNPGLALAAYNYGPGNVDKWLASGADPARLPTETRNYVQKITGQPIESFVGQKMAQAAPQGTVPGMYGLDPRAQQQMQLYRQNLPYLGAAHQRVFIEDYRSLLDAAKLTDPQKNYNNYLNQEVAAGRTPTKTMDQWLASQEGAKEEARIGVKGLYDYAAKHQDAYEKADATEQTINRMEQITNRPEFWSGPGAATGRQIAGLAAPIYSFFSKLGMSPNDPLMKKLETVQTSAALQENFTALSNQNILNMLGGSLGNQVSNADRDFIAAANVNLGMTPPGIKFMLDAQRRLVQRQKEIGRLTNQYMMGKGEKSQAELRQVIMNYAESHPLFTKEEKMDLPQGPAQSTVTGKADVIEPSAVAPRTPTPEAIDALRKNPNRAEEFDRHYNSPGLSKQYLQGGT